MKSSPNHRPVLETLEPRLLLASGLGPELMSLASPIDLPPAGEVSFSGQITPDINGLFTVTAKSRGVIEIAASGEGLVDPVLRVFNASGRLVARNSAAARGGNDSHLKLRAKVGRTLYVQIVDAHGEVGSYNLKINSDPYDDFGDTIAAAGRWRLNRKGAGTARGKINYADDVDFMSIVAPMSGRLQLDMSPRRQALDGELAIYDSAGNLMGSNDNANGGSNPSLSVIVQAGQTYYVKAFAHDSATGTYRLRASIQIEPPAPPPEPPTPPPPDPSPEPPADDPTPPAPPPDDPTPPAPADPVPGSAVAGQIVQTSGGPQLLIIGTDQADVITLSAGGNDVTLTTSLSTQTFSGSFVSIVLYGFGGNDTIRLTNSLAVGATIYGGTGDDSVFAAGQGADAVYSQEGDDFVVTIGGGADAIYGGDGADSVWMDGGDTMMDASAAETAAAAIHNVAKFYQPYTTDPSSAQYVPLTIAGQDFTDPVAGGGMTYASFAVGPLFANGPDYNDIRQGNVGDCYLVASLASVAQSDPTLIRQMIAPMGDGTYAVRFYRGGAEVYVRIDADLPTYSGGSLAYARLSPQGETWAAMIEKAYAYFRRGQNSYSSIAGGWMPNVYQEMTNLGGPCYWLGGDNSDMAPWVQAQMTAGHAATAASSYKASSPVVGGHAYMVKSVEITAQGTYITVYNPWGIDGVNFDSNSGDGLLRLSLAVFEANFDVVAVCAA